MIKDHNDFCEVLINPDPAFAADDWCLRFASVLDVTHPFVLEESCIYHQTGEEQTYNQIGMSIDQVRWLHERLTEVLSSVDRKFIEIRSGLRPSSLTDPDVGECLASFDLPLTSIFEAAIITAKEETTWHWRVYDGNRKVLKQGYSRQLSLRDVLYPGEIFRLYNEGPIRD